MNEAEVKSKLETLLGSFRERRKARGSRTPEKV